jgi:hypothetical protein
MCGCHRFAAKERYLRDILVPIRIFVGSRAGNIAHSGVARIRQRRLMCFEHNGASHTGLSRCGMPRFMRKK